MVYRGKPSKACERCRARRAKCDIRNGPCGQCIRAKTPCSGYRDTDKLRIQNESQSVMKKSLKNVPRPKIMTMPLSIDLQARDSFFAHYVTSRCWKFLDPYYHPTGTPKHLTLAIEACSLAYFWHQVHSDSALAIARERYALALQSTNDNLGRSTNVIKDTTLMTSLLLDLFEKVTSKEPQTDKLWTSHVDGALALAQLRGLEKFRDPTERTILMRLSTHYTINCISRGLPIPNNLHNVQAHIKKHLDVHDPTLRLSDLMIEFANLNSEIQRNALSNDETIVLLSDLDVKVQAFCFDLPPRWQYSSIPLDYRSQRVFDFYLDSYKDPKVCQAHNMIRIIRILLNEHLIEHCSSTPTSGSLALAERALKNIEKLSREICASVPQYSECSGAALQRLLPSERPKYLSKPTPYNPDHDKWTHSHNPNHKLDCYALIFPLYVVARSKAIPEMGPWVIEQLHYISSHFEIRNAKIIAQLLVDGIDVDPWKVWAMLGSYAFGC